MANQQYWDAVARHQTNTLTPSEQSYYRTLGIMAENQARAQGTTYLPAEWQKPDIQPQDMLPDVMVALGITMLGLADLNKTELDEKQNQR